MKLCDLDRVLTVEDWPSIQLSCNSCIMHRLIFHFSGCRSRAAHCMVVNAPDQSRWLETTRKALADSMCCISSTANNRTLRETSHIIHYFDLANAEAAIWMGTCSPKSSGTAESPTWTRFLFPQIYCVFGPEKCRPAA